MNRSTLFALLVFGGIILLANSAFAVTPRPKPGPPPTLPGPISDPQPVSQN